MDTLCGGPTTCACNLVPDEVAALDGDESVTIGMVDMEEAGQVLGVPAASSYAQRRAALMRRALEQSDRLRGKIKEVADCTASFDEAVTAFNVFANRQSELRVVEWVGDDLLPQMRCAEPEAESIPMSRLLSVACLGIRRTEGVPGFLLRVECSTRQEYVVRDFSALEALDDALRRLPEASRPANLPPLPPNPAMSFAGQLALAFGGGGGGGEARPPSTTIAAVDAYLRRAVDDLRSKNLYSAALFDFLDIDARERRKIHCDDVRLALCELNDLQLDDSEVEYAVSADWNDAWLAFLRSDTSYYANPGPPRNKDLAVQLTRDAISRGRGTLDDAVPPVDDYVLHSPAKWSLVTLIYGEPDITLELPCPKRNVQEITINGSKTSPARSSLFF